MIVLVAHGIGVFVPRAVATFSDMEAAQVYKSNAEREWSRLKEREESGKPFFNLGTEDMPFINALDPKAGFTPRNYYIYDVEHNPPLPTKLHSYAEEDEEDEE